MSNFFFLTSTTQKEMRDYKLRETIFFSSLRITFLKQKFLFWNAWWHFNYFIICGKSVTLETNDIYVRKKCFLWNKIFYLLCIICENNTQIFKIFLFYIIKIIFPLIIFALLSLMYFRKINSSNWTSKCCKKAFYYII